MTGWIVLYLAIGGVWAAAVAWGCRQAGSTRATPGATLSVLLGWPFFLWLVVVEARRLLAELCGGLIAEEVPTAREKRTGWCPPGGGGPRSRRRSPWPRRRGWG